MRYRIAHDGNRYCVQRQETRRFLWWTWTVWATACRNYLDGKWTKWVYKNLEHYNFLQGRSQKSLEDAQEVLRLMVEQDRKQAVWQGRKHPWKGVVYVTTNEVDEVDADAIWLERMKKEVATMGNDDKAEARDE